MWRNRHFYLQIRMFLSSIKWSQIKLSLCLPCFDKVLCFLLKDSFNSLSVINSDEKLEFVSLWNNRLLKTFFLFQVLQIFESISISITNIRNIYEHSKVLQLFSNMLINVDIRIGALSLSFHKTRKNESLSKKIFFVDQWNFWCEIFYF